MDHLKKLSYLLLHPVQFFEDNNDDKDALSSFTIFIIRMSFAIELAIMIIFVISIIIYTFFTGQLTISTLNFKDLKEFIGIIFIFIVYLLIDFFIRAPIGATVVEQFGRPIHWLVKWVTGKDDLLKAQRIAVYNTPFYAFLFFIGLPFIFFINPLVVLGITTGMVILLSFIWQTIGISKQYQLNYGKALFISFLPFLFLVGFFGLLFLYIGYNLGFKNMF